MADMFLQFKGVILAFLGREECRKANGMAIGAMLQAVAGRQVHYSNCLYFHSAWSCVWRRIFPKTSGEYGSLIMQQATM